MLSFLKTKITTEQKIMYAYYMHNKYLLLFPFKMSALLPKLAYLLASLSSSIVFEEFSCVNNLLQ